MSINLWHRFVLVAVSTLIDHLEGDRNITEIIQPSRKQSICGYIIAISGHIDEFYLQIMSIRTECWLINQMPQCKYKSFLEQNRMSH